MTDDLERELHRVLGERGDLREGEVVTAWAVVAAVQTIERSDSTGYSVVLSGDGMPTHVAAGLFRVGEYHCLRD